MLAVGGPVVYLLGQSAGLPALLASQTADWLGVSDARLVLAFSDEFLWNTLIALCTVAHVAGIAVLKPRVGLAEPTIRWMAGATFSIYVTHYPTLHLLDALLPEMAGRHALLFFGSVAIGLLFAQVFERPIKSFRASLALWFSRESKATAVRS